ncbi:MAG: MFS transporter [Haliscomenobacter sp.]|nr:MFS transporter [Haliscomenobacter sp.]
MYLRRAFSFYLRSFSGLSRDVWMLGFVSLINRSGAMVIPFLTVYMTQELGFTKPEAGLVMSCFGIGSVIGVYAGGQLTDRFGYYYVQLWSLLLTGAAFFLLMRVQGLIPFAGSIFVLSMVAEAFRPANFASIAAYARPENVTRSYSLIRLAVNLGFSVGPALGGWLAHGFGFQWLFIVDGATCIAAALIFYTYLRPKKETNRPKNESEPPASVKQSAYRDTTFLWFMLFVTITGIAFMQFFSVIPVFWREDFGLNEAQIGSLLAMNGLIIAFVEMQLVFRLEGRVEKWSWSV